MDPRRTSGSLGALDTGPHHEWYLQIVFRHRVHVAVLDDRRRVEFDREGDAHFSQVPARRVENVEQPVLLPRLCDHLHPQVARIVDHEVVKRRFQSGDA